MLQFSMSGGRLLRHEKARAKSGFLQACLESGRARLIVAKKNASAVATCAATAPAESWLYKLESSGAPVLDAATLVYVGEDAQAGIHIFATHPDNVVAHVRAGFIWRSPKSSFIEMLSVADQAALGAALSLIQWHCKSLYCTKCAAATSAAHDCGLSRRCIKCRAVYFPQLMPAILVAVLDGQGRVLLSQRRKASKQLTILSGFLSHGESAEEAVVREVEEETGARVRSMRYVGSQSWPYPYLTMLCYYAVAPMAANQKLRLQEEELFKVCWVSKEDVRKAIAGKHAEMEIPPPWTAAHQMLKPWVNGRIDDQGNFVSSHL